MLAGCGEAPAPVKTPPAKSELPFRVTLPHVSGLLDEPLQLFVDGKPTPPARSVETILVNLPSATPRLMVAVPLPCGRRDMAATVAQVMRQPDFGTPGAKVTPGEMLLSLKLGGAEMFIVDNRDRPDASLALGEMRRVIAAGKADIVGFPSLDCEAGAEASLDGRLLARLQRPEKPNPFEGRWWLVDPGGKRCYEYTRLKYSRHAMPGEAPEAIRLAKALVHLLPGKVNFVLHSAPLTVESRTFRETRTELVESPC